MSNLLLALDQSSKVTGWAFFMDEKLMKFGHQTYSDTNNVRRIQRLREWLLSQITIMKDSNLSIKVLLEDIQLQCNPITHEPNVTLYKTLAWVQGVLLELLEEQHVPYEIIPSTTWKSELKIKGKARDEQKRNAKIFVEEALSQKCTQDEADAICIGYCYLHKINNAIEFGE